VRASGLTRVWAVRYAPLREPGPVSRASAHVAGSVAVLAPGYRAAFVLALRLVPVCFVLVTGRRLGTASPRVVSAGAARLERLPVLGTVLRTTGALACCGALDGVPPAAPPARSETRERPWSSTPA
jgi:hypothetical protein